MAAAPPMAMAMAEAEEGEDISPAVLSEWEAVCTHIGLSPAAQAEGRKDLAAILRLGISPDTQRPSPVPWVWIACSAFVAAVRACYVVKEGKGKEGEGAVPEMGPILEATGVSAEELVTHLSLLAQRLPTLLCSVGEGEEGANLLAEVAWQLRHASLQTASIFAKCRQLWGQQQQHGTTMAPDSGDDNHKRATTATFTFVWYLYLGCKLQCLPPHAQTDLVAAFYLLLACLDFVLKHTSTATMGAGSGGKRKAAAVLGGQKSTKVLESLEEDAVAALFMMGGSTGGGPSSSLSAMAAAASIGGASSTAAASGSSSVVLQGLLESTALQVKAHVEELLGKGLRLGGEPQQTEEQEQEQRLSRLFHPEVLSHNLRILREDYAATRLSLLQQATRTSTFSSSFSSKKEGGEVTTAIVAAAGPSLNGSKSSSGGGLAAALRFLLDERFVLAFPSSTSSTEEENTAATAPVPPPTPSSAEMLPLTPNSKANGKRLHVFSTPRTSGRFLSSDYHDLLAASTSAMAPPFSPAIQASGGGGVTGGTVSFTPQKPPRPTTSARGMRTPVKASSSSPFAKGSGGGSPLMAPTPVSAALEAVHWVNSTLESLPPSPSTKLTQEYYKVAAAASAASSASSAPTDFHALVHARLQTLLERVTLPSSSAPLIITTKGPAEREREDPLGRARRLARALYYRMLLTLLDRESERLRSRNHAALLKHDGFHTSLLACCLEAVLRALSLSSLLPFSTLVARLRLSPLDFYKAQDSFLRACPGLPGLLRHHFLEIEAEILERALWADTPPALSFSFSLSLMKEGEGGGQAGSSCSSSSIKDNGKGEAGPSSSSSSSSVTKEGEEEKEKASTMARVFVLVAEAEAMGRWPVPSLADSSGNNEGAAAAAGGGEPSSSSSSSQEQKRPAPTNTNNTSSLDFVMRKVLLLAAQKVHALGRRLELPGDTLDRVWTTLKHSLRTHGLALLRNRHLDHPVLCAFYAMCKVLRSQPEVTFKRIIAAYRKIPHPLLLSPAHLPPSSSSAASTAAGVMAVVKAVPLPGGRHGDIIKFYNEMYIPLLKSYILQFAPQQAPHPSSSPSSAATTTATATACAKENSVPSSSPTSPTAHRPNKRKGKQAAAAAIAPGQQQETVEGGNGPSLPPSPPVVTRLPAASPSAHRSPQRIRQSNVYLTTSSSSASSSSPPNNRGEEPMMPQQQIQQQLQAPPTPSSAAAAAAAAAPSFATATRHMMTPRTRVLYAFGESPAKDLDAINRAVNRPRAAAAHPSPSKSPASAAAAAVDGMDPSLLQRRTSKRLRL